MRTLAALLLLSAPALADEPRAQKRPPPGAIVPDPQGQPLAIPGDGVVVVPNGPAGAMTTEPDATYAYPNYTDGVDRAERPHLTPQELPPPAAPPTQPAPAREPLSAAAVERVPSRARSGVVGAFGHATAGFGPAWAPASGGGLLTGQGRFSAGGTAWATFVYGGGSLELGGSGFAPMSMAGAGRFGAALPLPRGRFLLGAHIGGGAWFSGAGVGPQAQLGPEVGFVTFGKRGKLGVRVQWEFDAVYRPTGADHFAWLLGAGLAF